jgi:hypothetical protein
MNEDKHFKDALSAVLIGYSVTTFQDERVFIKHFGVTDSVETDYQYDLAFNGAVKRGIKTEKEKLDYLQKENLWTEADEANIRRLTSETENLKKRRAMSAIPSQVDGINKKIDENEQILNSELGKRIRLVGTTAESLANKRSEDYYIYNSLFLDNKLSKNFFTDNFEEIDAELLEQSKFAYYQGLKYILRNNIKKIALCKEFIDLMHLAQDPYQILGKPYCHYTYFQIDLISLGRFYKLILSQEVKPPQGILKDPDKLEQWWETSQNAQKISSKNHE